MWKAGIAGALALATIGSSLSLAGESRARHEFRPAARTGVVLTNAQIARIKTVLKLTRAQEQYWPPVAAALPDGGFALAWIGERQSATILTLQPGVTARRSAAS